VYLDFKCFFGTFFLFCCGLDGAVHEGLDHVLQNYAHERVLMDQETDNLLEQDTAEAKNTM